MVERGRVLYFPSEEVHWRPRTASSSEEDMETGPGDDAGSKNKEEDPELSQVKDVMREGCGCRSCGAGKMNLFQKLELGFFSQTLLKRVK